MLMRILTLTIVLGLIQLSCSTKNDLRVGIQPLGDVDPELIDTISTNIEKIYKIKTVKLDKIPIPQETFINTITPRYRADKLIKYLKENKADTLAY
jgi:archaemetzincin